MGAGSLATRAVDALRRGRVGVAVGAVNGSAYAEGSSDFAGCGSGGRMAGWPCQGLAALQSFAVRVTSLRLCEPLCELSSLLTNLTVILVGGAPVAPGPTLRVRSIEYIRPLQKRPSMFWNSRCGASRRSPAKVVRDGRSSRSVRRRKHFQTTTRWRQYRA